MLETILASGTALVVLAIITESLTEILKTFIPANIHSKATFALSIVLGIVLAFAMDLSLLGGEGYVRVVGILASGILVSRGANYISGFIKKFDLVKNPTDTKKE